MLHTTQVVSIFYVYVLAIAGIIALFRFKRIDLGSRLLCCWIWLGIITELTSRYWSLHHGGNNMPVYTVSSFVEFIIICSFFQFSLPYFQRTKTPLYIAALGTILGILNTVYVQPIEQSNSNFIFFECLSIFAFGLYAIYKMLLADNIRLTQQIKFWFTLSLLFYQCGSLWNWGFYNFAVRQSVETVLVLNLTFLIINLMTYSGIALVLLLYPKMRNDHV